MKKRKLNQSKGITLISLVITIIVLLILAAVSIGLLLVENGLLTRANESTEATSYVAAEEKVKLAVLGSYDNTGIMSDKLIVEELYKFENQGMTSLTDKDSTNIAKDTLDLTNKYPIKTVVDGYEFEIEKTGNVTGDETSTGNTGNNGNTEEPEGLKPGEVAGVGGEKYIDINNKTAFVIEGGSISGETTEDTIAEGLVMKLDNNEYVWVEVPDDIFQTATSEIDYEGILNDIETYTTEPDNYRAASGYGIAAADISQAEVWYNGNGLTEEEYTILKQNILSGIYKNEGFWVGRYEVGNESNTPVIQNNKVPYTGVKVSEAQDKAESIKGTGYNGTLMLGVQWDLILKFMEANGTITSGADITYKTLFEDSTDIGNYGSSKKSNTGVTAKAKVLNIYDIAGNVCELTLEKGSNSSNDYCVYRGGYYYHSGSRSTVVSRYYLSTGSSNSYVGFRVILY